MLFKTMSLKSKIPETLGAVISYLLNIGDKPIHWYNHLAATGFAIVAGVVVHVARKMIDKLFKKR